MEINLFFDVFDLTFILFNLFDERTLKLSPLTEDDGVDFVSSGDDFAKIIRGGAKATAKKRQGENYFYLDENLTRWRELLVDDYIIK